MKSWREINSAVHYTTDTTGGLNDDGIEFLLETLPASPQNRTRVCTHSDPEDLLQEMMIALGRDGYIRPHRHPGKAESLHVIQGEARLLLFEDDGRLRKVVSLRPPGAGGVWYFRISDPVFHTLLLESESFVFHETTMGPFTSDSSEFAPWSPETDSNHSFRDRLWELIRK